VITLPEHGSSVYGTVKCTIDKRNADAKNPPKFPFLVAIAMKTNRDVWYFNVPCMLHNLLNIPKPLQKDDFKKYWDKLAH
jgi:hypothetical protein